MFNGKANFPQQKPERRQRARSRPNYSDRRIAPRYDCGFPVDVYLGDPGKGNVYQALARDISDGGLMLENIDIPETETRIRVEFKIPEGGMPEEFLHGKLKLEGVTRRRDEQKKRVGVAFEESLSKRLGRRIWPYLNWTATMILFVAVCLVLWIKIENLYSFWADALLYLYSLAVGFYLLSRFLFASFYRPPKPIADEDLPKVTVVIPAYNEEEYIERTLVHVLDVSYPQDKLQVITVNDGSEDGTLSIMQRVRNQYPELVVVDFPKNTGKREAMAVGAQMATGEIVVFVDSDSFLHHDAIRNIVDGFADPKVAGVCGHCEVENKWSNVLCKMQAVRYYVSFRVIKAAESIFGTITCLSGPLAAYRRTALMEVLDTWLKQRFAGVRATFGDDRGLTTFLMRHYKVIYDARALTATIVPESYGKLFLQQARWKRSWFRESIRQGGFMWRREPLAWISFYLGVILPIISPVVVFRAMIYIPVVRHGTPLMYMFGILLMSALMSSVYLFAKRSRLWVYGVWFCFFYMFVLVWQMPWAMLSYMRPSWSTRKT